MSGFFSIAYDVKDRGVGHLNLKKAMRSPEFRAKAKDIISRGSCYVKKTGINR